MQELRIGLIGLGTVGAAVLEILKKEQQILQKRTGVLFRLVRICDRSWEKKRQLLDDIPISAEPEDICNDSSVDVVVELVGGVEPTRFWLRMALEAGKSVVTANKALLASSYGNDLLALAYKKGVELCFEAAVGGAIPLIQSLRHSFVADSIESFYGILNGTCNYVLSEMEAKAISYEQALAMAQEKGYAEADPSFDVQGLDAAQKLSILAALAFDMPIPGDKVSIKGISGIEQIDLQFAAHLGYSIRPLALAKRNQQNNTCHLSVYPAMIPQKHFLASICGTMNAALIESSYSEKLVFIGPGAGGFPTASAVISDLVLISQKKGKQPECWLTSSQWSFSKQKQDLTCRFYLRLCVEDRPGVLADITRILAEHEISIATLHQDDRGEPVDVVVLTHKIAEEKLDLALEKIKLSSGIQKPVVAIQIEERI